MRDLREAVLQALAFTMRDFATVRDFEAAKAKLRDSLRAALDSDTAAPDLLEALNSMIDLAEFWINHRQERYMSEEQYRVWLALGHKSNAMIKARAAIARATGVQ